MPELRLYGLNIDAVKVLDACIGPSAVVWGAFRYCICHVKDMLDLSKPVVHGPQMKLFIIAVWVKEQKLAAGILA